MLVCGPWMTWITPGWLAMFEPARDVRAGLGLKPTRGRASWLALGLVGSSRAELAREYFLIIQPKGRRCHRDAGVAVIDGNGLLAVATAWEDRVVPPRHAHVRREDHGQARGDDCVGVARAQAA